MFYSQIKIVDQFCNTYLYAKGISRIMSPEYK